MLLNQLRHLQASFICFIQKTDKRWLCPKEKLPRRYSIIPVLLFPQLQFNVQLRLSETNCLEYRRFIKLGLTLRWQYRVQTQDIFSIPFLLPHSLLPTYTPHCSAPFLKHPQSKFFLLMRNYMSHSYEETGKITVPVRSL